MIEKNSDQVILLTLSVFMTILIYNFHTISAHRYVT